ncbi:MAG: hypothetical protein P9L97_05605 [Candidatus Tenebribacter davisii]|jgi:hypothetical protein|nr:hypothetical protein [Candidatus Tenebribacter davisii]
MKKLRLILIIVFLFSLLFANASFNKVRHLNYSIIWNDSDNNNKPVTSGLYFYRLKTNNFEKTNKMILIK